MKEYIKNIDLEKLLWITALVFLIFVDPAKEQVFTLCLFHNLGIESCPGCGLGRSISYFYRGEISNSLSMHPLGIFAFFIILYRILSLQINSLKKLR